MHTQNKQVLEPFERVVVDVQEEHVGGVMENLCSRKAEMLSMSNSDDGRTKMEFLAPSRALVGYVGMFQLHTRGTGILNKIFDSCVLFVFWLVGRSVGRSVGQSVGACACWRRC